MKHKTPLASLKHFQKGTQTEMFLLYFSISKGHIKPDFTDLSFASLAVYLLSTLLQKLQWPSFQTFDGEAKFGEKS